MARALRCSLAAALMISLSGAPAQAEEDYDMDCAIILCMAGGFPVGCASAYAHMMERLLSFPPKPPFGFCGFLDNGDIADAPGAGVIDAMSLPDAPVVKIEWGASGCDSTQSRDYCWINLSTCDHANRGCVGDYREVPRIPNGTPLQWVRVIATHPEGRGFRTERIPY